MIGLPELLQPKTFGFFETLIKISHQVDVKHWVIPCSLPVCQFFMAFHFDRLHSRWIVKRLFG